MGKQNQTFQFDFLPTPDLVVLPGTVVSFYLHDTRYIEMVKGVVANNGQIVVSFTEHVKDTEGQIISGALIPRSTGVVAIPSIEDDNRITLTGLCKVKIRKIVSTSPNIVVEASQIDVDHSMEEDLKLFEVLKRLNVSSIHSGMAPDIIINCAILQLVESKEHRQFLLETHKVKEQLDHLSFILRCQDQKIKVPVNALEGYSAVSGATVQ